MKITDMSTITVHNFSYYALHPTAPSLSRQDQKIAIIATALLAVFTLGLGHLVCAIIYAVLKKNFELSLIAPTFNNVFRNTVSQGYQISQPINRNNQSNDFFSENERGIRQFERDARRLSDPLLRSGAYLAADVGRGLNQVGQGLLSLF